VIIKNPEYLKLWTATFLSAVGRWMYYTILAVFIHDSFNSQQFAGWAISYMLPLVLFSPLAGFFVDKYCKKNLISISILTAGLLPCLLFLSKSIYIIYLVCSLDTCFSVILYLSTRSWIKDLTIDKQTFVSFHSWLVIGQLLPNIIGSGIGGFFLTSLSLEISLLINLFLCLLSLLISFFIKINNIDDSYVEKFTTNVKEGFLFIWKNPFIWNAIAYFSILMFSYSFLSHFFVYFWANFFPGDTTIYGSSLAFSGISIILGTLTSKKVTPKFDNYHTTLILCLSSSFVLFLLISLSFFTFSKLIFFMIFIFIHFFYAFARNIHTILITFNATAEFQGRVLSVAYMCWNGSSLISILSSGLVIKSLGVTCTLFYYSLIGLLMCLILGFLNLNLKYYVHKKFV